ncbi:MAG: undecaprenyl-diphosphate phosphatase [Oscillospiraceae bacterium]
MTVIEGFLQGVLQGFTEFLPVSSSGHLSLFQHLFGLQSENALFFSVMLHVGTLLAVFIAFHKTIIGMIVETFKMIGDIFTRKFRFKEANENRRAVIMVLLSLVVLLPFLLIKDAVTALSEDSDILVEGVCFLITSALLLLADRSVKGYKTAVDMTVKDAVVIGCFQGLAVLPGVSRSGSTISAGLMRGFSREFMVGFSFIMGIPAIMGASLLELKDALAEGVAFSPALIVGMVTSAVFGLAAIKLVSWLVKTDRFAIFAYYTLALGIAVVSIGIIEHIAGANIVEVANNIFTRGVA